MAFHVRHFINRRARHSMDEVAPEDAPMDLVQGHVDDQADTVSAIHKCQSKNAVKLCIFDIGYKLKQMDTYDIGATYTDKGKDLWFYYSTSVCPGYNFLLNLFVCHRKAGNFSIGISNSNELTHHKKQNQSSLPESLMWHTFRSAKSNESHFIKTFCFTDNDIKTVENTLFIPITIDMNPMHILNNDVIKRIKLNHDFGDLLVKQEKTDFILESASQRQFNTHKIILAAHSPVLRTMIQNTKSNSEFIDISDSDMELLLQFMYTGTITDVLKQDCLRLLEIANRFELKNLFLLTQYALKEQINVDNAVQIATLTEKYSLDQLQADVFDFIRKNNDAVVKTDGWKNLDDVKLAKKLFQQACKRKTFSD